jgi:hypothetical protein
MNILEHKLVVIVLVCVSVLLAWCCWHFYGQTVSASFIERQCMITQDMIDHPADGFVPQGLAVRLDFLMGYYDYYGRPLRGSPIEWVVSRDYQQTLTNAVTLFRSQTTNDLGSDPRAWIKKYEN